MTINVLGVLGLMVVGLQAVASAPPPGDGGSDRATSGSGPAQACRRSLAHGRNEEPWV